MPERSEAMFYEHRGDATPLRRDRQSDDPITTQIVRHALASAANQMVKTTVRTAFSPVVYESLDFAAVLYDRDYRLLGQGATLPAFMGTMSFCIEFAVHGVGGAQSLQPGDILLYNVPYGTGSHAQDCAVVMPVFDRAGTLVGYAANKCHWADIGAKNHYCTDTTELFQEGLLLPGVKLYERGVLNNAVYRIILANSRFPDMVEGDLKAQIASCNVGGAELIRIVDRFGYDVFSACVERMIDHGESTVRAFLANVPDGTYRSTCHMDSNGVDDDPIVFDVSVTIEGSDVLIDYSEAPDAQRGPVNCPLPSTVSLSRILLAMIAGSQEAPNEGLFRPLRVRTRRGSMFHPESPAPSFLYGWGLMSAMEGIIDAFADAVPGLPSGGAGDICSLDLYGADELGRPFSTGSALPVGHGANEEHDGAILFVPSLANSRNQSVEITEQQNPLRVEKWEIVPDSGGPGRHRGGPGWQLAYRTLSESRMISVVERTLHPSTGRDGGLPGMPNRLELEHPDGRIELITKVTGRPAAKGSIFRIFCGGGGGYGAPALRTMAAVENDLEDGIVTPEHVAIYYPHVVR